jgi:membrane-bound serine protease (ClpP class)
MLIILLGAYVEFLTPGVGVPGLTALICLAIFVGAPYLSGLANVWEILLVVLGLVLMGLELFVIPGFGVAGVSGIVLVVIGLLATFVPDEPGRSFPLFFPSLPDTMAYVRGGVITLVASLAASLAGMGMLSRYLPRTPFFRRLVPANPAPSDVMADDPYRGAARVGDLGETQGMLRPSGKARFGGVLVDVVTQGEFIEPRVRVEVIERRGNRVVVRPAVV